MTSATAATKYKDAIALLVHDHREVKKAFKKYESLGEKAFVSKKKLADQICLALTKHTVIEEEIFYPAARKALGHSADLIDEALVEHASAKDLIVQIQSMSAEEGLFDAKVKVLSEQIDHHVAEEENEMFPKMRTTKLDLVELGEYMSARLDELDAYL